MGELTQVWGVLARQALMDMGVFVTDIMPSNVLVFDPATDMCLFADIGGMTTQRLDTTHTCTFASLETPFKQVSHGLCPVTRTMVNVQCAFLATTMCSLDACNHMYRHMTWCACVRTASAHLISDASPRKLTAEAGFRGRFAMRPFS